MSNSIRITGMASGLDVDSLVKQMMKTYTMRLDKVKQDRQLIEWKQQLYRDSIGDLNTFKSTYFDVLKSDTYMLSEKNYASFDVKSSDSTNSITATASAGAKAGNYTISVAQLAEIAKFQSPSCVNTKEAYSPLTFPIVVNSNNDELTVNGKAVNSLTSKTYSSISALAAEINSKLSSTVDGTGNLSDSVQAIVNNGKIQFINKVKIDDTNKTLKVSVSGNNFDLTLDKNGNYSLSDIVSQINAKLPTLKDSGGTSFPNGVTAALSNDGLSIEFKNADNTPVVGAKAFFTDGTTEVNTTVASIVSENTSVLPGANSIPNTPGNGILTYEMKIFSGVNDSLTVTLGNGTVKNISLTNLLNSVASTDIGSLTNADIDTIAGNLTAAFSGAGLSNITVSRSQSGNLLFKSTSSDQITISGNGVGTLGIKSGFEINQTAGDLMSNLISGPVNFTVNNVVFQYDFSTTTDNGSLIGAKNRSISSILDDIKSKAGVDISYSELTRQYTLTSQSTGTSQVIVNTQDNSGNFLSTLFGQSKITDANGYLYNTNLNAYSTTTKLQGKDAQVTITEPNSAPVTIYKSENNFTVDGVTYTLNNKPAGNVTLTLTSNGTATFDKIKAFVTKYNELIDKINEKITEKKQYDYLPLTDEQKESMKDDDITKWEEKAKEGLLRNDSTLDNMLMQMRRAFFDPVKTSYNDSNSIGKSLSDIGLSTSSDYSQRGKIIIDEAKLKDAIENKGSKVQELLMKTSSTYPQYSTDMSYDSRGNRYAEEGIFQRLNDILEDNLRTVRDAGGKKGTLLEKAGIKGDYTEYHNYLTDELNDKDKLITSLNTKISDREEYYYLQFSKLEQAMQQMNTQSTWLTQQISGMSGN
jgi:flagellar hook-associated protein 2